MSENVSTSTDKTRCINLHMYNETFTEIFREIPQLIFHAVVNVLRPDLLMSEKFIKVRYIEFIN